MESLCLGIECTAHTFGCAVASSDGRILSNEKAAFTSQGPGIVPREVAKQHEKNSKLVLQVALEKANVTEKDLSFISLSQGPGIGNCLQVGFDFAKVLKKQLKIPLVGVNHCIAHLEIGRLLSKAQDPVMLYASGANTQVIAYEGKKYRVFGETLDIGVGNMLDKLAREMNLGFPGGPALYQLSLASKNFLEMPYTVKGMDVCFSGLLTDAIKKFKSGKYSNDDIAFSIQEVAFSMLIEVAERALAHCDKDELLLAGGVAASAILRDKAKKMCEGREGKQFKFYSIEPQYCVDNAAMIAWLGQLTFNSNKKFEEPKKILPHWRTEQVDVTWRQ